MDRVVNLRLMAHPLNWGIVWVVLLLAGYAFAIITHNSTSCGCDGATHLD